MSEAVGRELARWEEERLPLLQMPSEVQLGDIFYAQPRTFHIPVRNIGQLEAHFRVQQPFGQSSRCGGSVSAAAGELGGVLLVG